MASMFILNPLGIDDVWSNKTIFQDVEHCIPAYTSNSLY